MGKFLHTSDDENSTNFMRIKKNPKRRDKNLKAYSK